MEPVFFRWLSLAEPFMRASVSLPAILLLLQVLNLGASLFAHLSSQQALAHVRLAEQRLLERISDADQVKQELAMVVDPSAGAFVQAAKGTATDKIDAHSFQFAYHRYLAAHRWKELRVLEIGLGCGMPRGPGGSVVLWSRYLPRALLTILEYDSAQNQNVVPRMPAVVFGDQRDRKLLQSVVKNHGPFDVIVDDGGHSMDMQIISFQELFLSLKSEGLYFMEDLHTSFLTTPWGGHQDGVTGTAVGYILNRTRDLIADSFKAWDDEKEVAGIIQHIDCYKHMCVIQRK